VSQIIRSPGIYFEKNKNQKPHHPFKRKLSIDLNKLRSFVPSGQASISEFDLFFAIPTKTEKNTLIPQWQKDSIYYYSIQYFKQT
jgi:hypothetical protein